jgi:hypothetical protein
MQVHLRMLVLGCLLAMKALLLDARQLTEAARLQQRPLDANTVAAFARTGARGRPAQYSNVAIDTTLFIRQVLRLPFRQTEGLMNSLARALKVEISIPDFSCISKRSIGLPRQALSKALEPGSLVIVDSTGLKVYGKDEWHQEKHDVPARRTWRKLHLAKRRSGSVRPH